MKPCVLAATFLLGASLAARGASGAPAVGPEFSLDPGVVVPAAVYSQAIAWDGSQYFVATSVSTSTDATPATTNSVLYGVRVDAGGTVLDPGGIAVDGAGGSAAVAYGAGYFLVATTGCHAVRVASDGTVVDTTPISLSSGTCASPSVTFDGTNFLVSAVQPPFAMAWRVSPAGVVLDSSPIQFSRGVGLVSASAGFNGSSHVVLYATGSGPIGYVNISETGSVGGGGSIGIGSAPAIACDGATGCLAAWAVQGATSWTIQGAQIGPSGALTISHGAIPTSASPTPTVTWDGTHYLVVWSNGSTLLGARVTGNTVVDPADIVIQSASQSPAPAMASQPSGSLLVYTSAPLPNGFGYPPAQAVRLNAALVEQGQPFPYALITPSEAEGAIASNGTGYLTSWTDYAQGEVRACRLNASGTPADSPPVVISTTGEAPAAAALGTNYLLVWTEFSLDAYGDIYGALVPAQGPPGAPFAISAKHTGDQSGEETYAEVASNGTGYLVTWMDNRNSQYIDAGISAGLPALEPSTYAARISPTGVVMDPNGIEVMAGISPGGVASNGSDYLVLTSPNSLYATPVSADGSVGAARVIASLSDGGTGVGANGLTFAGGQYLAVWSTGVSNGGVPPTVYGSLLTASGGLSSSAAFGMCNGTGCWDPYLVSVGDAFYATWFAMHPGYPADLFYDVYGAGISSTGVVLSPPNGELVTSTTPTTSESGPIIALRDGSNGVMLYNTEETDGYLKNFRMRARLVSFDGGLAIGANEGGTGGSGQPDASTSDGASAFDATVTEEDAAVDSGTSRGSTDDAGASAIDATTTDEDAVADGGGAHGPTHDGASSGVAIADGSTGGSVEGGGNSSGCSAAPSGRTANGQMFGLVAVAGLVARRARRPRTLRSHPPADA